MTQTPQAPPGWYDDGRGARRWWDGTAWTEHVQPLAPMPPAPPFPPYPMIGGSPRRRRRWPWALGGVVGGLVALAAIGFIALALTHASDHEVAAAEKVADHFMSAGDAATLQRYADPAFAANSQGRCDATQARRLTTAGAMYRIVSSKRSGEEAIVEVQTTGTHGLTVTLTMRRDAGDWKVDKMACRGGE